MKFQILVLKLILVFSVFLPLSTQAANFKYRKRVTLSVGKSIVLKGVRSYNCGRKGSSWKRIRRGLPRSRLGVFVDGGSGTTISRRCGGKVGARGVRFIAKRPGKETLTIYKDRVSITVRGNSSATDNGSRKSRKHLKTAKKREKYLGCLFKAVADTSKATGRLEYSKKAIRQSCSRSRARYRKAIMSTYRQRKKNATRTLLKVEKLAFVSIDQAIRQVKAKP